MEENKKNFNYSLIIYAVIVILFVGLRIISAFDLLSVFGSYAGWFFTFVVQILLLLGVSVLLFSLFKKQKPACTFEYFGCKRVSKKIVWLSILIGAIIFFLNVFVSSIFNSFIDFLGYEHSTSLMPSSYNFLSLLLNLVFSALLPGFCEEIVHRGMLLKSLRPMGMWKAIIFSGVLFGLLHLNIEQFFYATIIGVFLGFLTVMTNSIYPAMIVHFINNALSVYVVFSRVNNLPFGKLYETFFTVISSNIFLGVLLSFVVILLFTYLLVLLCKKLFSLQLKTNFEQAAQIVQKKLIKEAYFYDLENTKRGIIGGDEILVDPRLEIIKQLFAMNPTEKEKFSPPLLGKFLLWWCIALMGVLTVFTFVWGVL